MVRGATAVVEIALDAGGTARLELLDFDLARLADQYFFV